MTPNTWPTPPWRSASPLPKATRTPPKPIDPFDTAAFYECDEHAESFKHRTVIDALIGYLDECCDLASCDDAEVRSRFGDAAKIISDFCGKHGPIKVYAYKRGTVEPAFTAHQARRATDDVVDAWCEEYSGDGDAPSTQASKEAIETARVRIEMVLTRLFVELPVWNCERVGERTFLASEVIALVRAQRPEWFDGEAGR